jgi:hypothetical protein
MAAQTLPRSEWKWVVASDIAPLNITGLLPHDLPLSLNDWRDGVNTHGENIRRALSLISYSAPVVMAEDDDYYPPDWLQTCRDALKSCDMFGEYGRPYYNVKNMTYEIRSGVNKPANGAPMGATAFKGEKADDLLRQVLLGDTGEPNPKLDVKFWRAAKKAGLRLDLRKDLGTVSIKGLPGRPGITDAHRKRLKEDDKDGHMLEMFVGKDNAKAILEAAKC